MNTQILAGFRRLRDRMLCGDLPHCERAGSPGRSRGHRCICCDKTIQAGDLQYDVRLSNERIVPAHQHCYLAWREESLLLKDVAVTGGLR